MPLFLGPTLNWNTTELVLATNGSEVNQVYQPFSIFIPDGSDFLYVADYGNYRVLQRSLIDSSSTIVAGGQGPGANATQLQNPGAVFVDKSGGILVMDCGNARAQYFENGSRVGRTVAGDGTQGTASNQLGAGVGGIALDSEDNVYVSEYGNNRVTK